MQNNQRNPDIQVSHQARGIRKTAVKAVMEAMKETMEVAEGEAPATSAIQEVDRKRSHQQSIELCHLPLKGKEERNLLWTYRRLLITKERQWPVRQLKKTKPLSLCGRRIIHRQAIEILDWEPGYLILDCLRTIRQ